MNDESNMQVPGLSALFGEIFYEIRDEGLITFPEVLTDVKDEIFDFLNNIVDGEGENDIYGTKNLLKQNKDGLKETIRRQLIKRNETKQGYLSEPNFWKYQKKLKEAIRKIRQKKEPIYYENIFGISKNGEAESALWTKYNLAPVFYLHLGLVGGSFAIIDSSKENFIILHDKELQEITDTNFNFNNLPFIQIPYRYNKSSEDKISNTKEFRKTLDAMYISIRQSQRIEEKLEYSPEFFHYLPSLISEDDRNKLPPFEKELIKDGFNLVYCTVGEVLFHLYAWRMLFRKIQTKNQDSEKLCIDRIVTTESSQEFESFELSHDFWEAIRKAKDKGLNLPELDWLEYLEILQERAGQMDKTNKINNLWKTEFKEKIDNLGSTIVNGGLERESKYEMSDEYEYLGLIKIEKGDKYYTREFLELIRYTIHIARAHLGWRARKKIIKEESDKAKEQREKKEDRLTKLYTMERKLERILYSADNDENDENQLASFIKKSNEVLSDKTLSLEVIDKVLRSVVKSYLMEGEKNTQLYKLLEQLHRKCRFPILPYYYELAIGDEHQPKEHLIICNWDSLESKYQVNNKEGIKEDTGAAFSILTLNPIWTIKSKYTFCKDGKSIHYVKELSKPSLTRLFRLIALFNPLAQPIIDEFFYGSLIKKDVELDVLVKSISSFSHELTKIAHNIFDYSNIPLKDLFNPGERASILNRIIDKIDGPQKPSITELSEWAVIPNISRFKSWSNNLMIYSGKEQMILEVANQSIYNIIKQCIVLSMEMNIGERLKAAPKPTSYSSILLYSERFNKWKLKLEKIPFTFLNQNIAESIFCPSISASDDQDSNFNKLKVNAFIRLILACSTNIFEHVDYKNGEVCIGFSYDKELNNLKIEFINSFVNFSPDRESVGTKPVLVSCLNLIAPNTSPSLNFNSIKKKEEYQISKIMTKAPKGSNFWKTSFTIPLNNLFQINNLHNEVVNN